MRGTNHGGIMAEQAGIFHGDMARNDDGMRAVPMVMSGSMSLSF